MEIYKNNRYCAIADKSTGRCVCRGDNNKFFKIESVYNICVYEIERAFRLKLGRM